MEMQLGRALHFAVNLDSPVVGWLLFSQALIWIRHQEFPLNMNKENTSKGGSRRRKKSLSPVADDDGHRRLRRDRL